MSHPQTAADRPVERAEYFFYKNGAGNAWTAYTLEHGELYVGFDDTWRELRMEATKRDPDLSDRTILDFFTDADFKRVAHKYDVRHIFELSRQRAVQDGHDFLMTFTPGWLFVWRASGPLREHRPGTEDWERVRDHWLRFCEPVGPEPGDRTAARRRKKEREDARAKAIAEGVLSPNALAQLMRHSEFEDALAVLGAPDSTSLKSKAKRRYGDDAYWKRVKTHKSATGFPVRFLPVEMVARIPRQELFTSVDSISVYRNLNSNTCTSLRTVTGTDPRVEVRTAPEEFGTLDWPLPDSAGSPSHLRRLEARTNGLSLPDEKPFGQFLRLYLNSMVVRRWTNAQPPVLARLDARMSDALLPAVLNPILVETAALALVRDVGLTPDIGVGKGMDVVDVRARAVGRNGTVDPQVAAFAADTLSEILTQCGESLPAHQAWLAHLRAHGVLDIQCKAAGDKIVASREGVLFVGYPPAEKSVRMRSGERSPPALSVTALARWAQRPEQQERELSRFFAMQAAVLRGDWHVGASASP
jgi:hypothetical protein